MSPQPRARRSRQQRLGLTHGKAREAAEMKCQMAICRSPVIYAAACRCRKCGGWTNPHPGTAEIRSKLRMFENDVRRETLKRAAAAAEKFFDWLPRNEPWAMSHRRPNVLTLLLSSGAARAHVKSRGFSLVVVVAVGFFVSTSANS